MPTAKAIEEITDAGDFEILATRVLRLTDEDYRNVEHLGVNADGKTIKGPVDGFCKVPGSSPSIYVTAGFSTDVADKIENKLLFDHTKSKGTSYTKANDGDLLKASRRADTIRQKEPDAKFIFTFCTNKQPNEDVMSDGYLAAKDLGIELRFLARSNIRDCLDTSREGQWLRKTHLGIEADKVSLSMLDKLSKQSVALLASELFCEISSIVPTRTISKLNGSLRGRRNLLNLVVGESGSGKSVASYAALSRIVEEGGIGLWISDEFVETSDSLIHAISRTLKSLNPFLDDNCGHDLLQLATTIQRPLVFVVDDINRTKNVAKSVRKLIGWQRRLDSGDALAKDASPITGVQIIVPIWSQHWSRLSSSYDSSNKLNEIPTRRMSKDEAVACIQRLSEDQSLTQQAVIETARSLEFDPILIGLWGQMSSQPPVANLSPTGLVASFIETTIQHESNDDHLPADLRNALNALTTKMLENRELYPSWQLVNEWLSDAEFACIRHITVSSKLCRVSHRNGIDRLEFRHDRLLEAALAEPIKACLAQIDENIEVLSDPYFAETISRALVALNNPDHVSKLIEVSPLSLVYAVRKLTDGKSDFEQRVIESVGDWLVEATASDFVSPEITWEAGKILQRIENPFVLTVTERVKKRRDFWGARLVNGDALIGKYFVWSNNVFAPAVIHDHLEAIVGHAVESHGAQLIQQLISELKSDVALKEQSLSASLTLAGYIGDSSLAEHVLAAWQKQKGCLLEALWAAMRCSSDPEKTVKPMLEAWQSLSDSKEGDSSFSQQERLFGEIEFCVRHGLPQPVIHYLVELANSGDSLNHYLTGLLQKLDNPDAVTCVAMKVAKLDAECEGTESYSPWTMMLRREWDALNSRGMMFSDASKDAVLKLYADESVEKIKGHLLRLWLQMTGSIDDLKKLPQEVFDSGNAVWRRARLGDVTATKLVLGEIKTDKHWFYVVPPIWSKAFVPAVDDALGELAAPMVEAKFDFEDTMDHRVLAETLRDIPREVARQLLCKHWDGLQYSRHFLQVAIYIGGEELESSVSTTLTDAPESLEPFKLLSHTFGFNTAGLADRLTVQQFESLEPFIDQLDESAFWRILRWIERRGLFLNSCFAKYKEEAEKRSKADQDDKRSMVTQFLQEHFPTDAELLEQLDACETGGNNAWRWASNCVDHDIEKERISSTLQTWFRSNPGRARLKTATDIVEQIGIRADAEWLQKCQASHGDDSTRVDTEGAVFRVFRRTLS